MNTENVIFNRYVGQSSASTFHAASPAGKIISIPLPDGGHSKGKCLGNSFGTKGGAGVCALGSTPAAAMASHGSAVALPALRILLCIPYTAVWRWEKLSSGSSQAHRDTLLGWSWGWMPFAGSQLTWIQPGRKCGPANLHTVHCDSIWAFLSTLRHILGPLLQLRELMP